MIAIEDTCDVCGKVGLGVLMSIKDDNIVICWKCLNDMISTLSDLSDEFNDNQSEIDD